MRRAIGNLLRVHYSRPYTKFLTVPAEAARARYNVKMDKALSDQQKLWERWSVANMDHQYVFEDVD